MYFCSRTIADTDSDETILDYAFISEENFLIVLALTSKADIISYLKSSSKEQTNVTSARTLYPEWLEPILISITADASVVSLVQNNGDILVFPIKYLIDVNWCSSNNICTEPVLIKVDVGETNPLYKLPTCAISFTSKFLNKPYIIYGNKGGGIIIVNLAIKMVTACIKCNGTIRRLEISNDKDYSYLLVTENWGAQSIILLETPKCSLRETTAHLSVEPSQRPLFQYYCLHNDSRVLAICPPTNIAYVFRSIAKYSEDAISEIKLPEKTWMINFMEKALVCVNEANNVYFLILFLSNDDGTNYKIHMTDLSEKLLGIVPLVGKTEDLEDCFLITEKQLLVFKPICSMNEVILNFLAQDYFSAPLLNQIAKKLNKDVKIMAKNILEITLKTLNTGQSDDTSRVNGALGLAMESKVEMNEIIKLLTDYNETDMIVPFLTAMCQRDSKYWNNLMEVHEIRLKKLKNQENEISEEFERELKECFYHCNASKPIISLLLKNKMWSCIFVLLSKEAFLYSEIIADYLMELNTLYDVPTNQLAKWLNLIAWSTVESRALPLLTKVITFISHVDIPSELVLFANFGKNLIPKVPTQALVLFAIATIRYLHFSKSKNLSTPDITPMILSVGSNCAVAINSDDLPVFWGEFSAGNLRVPLETRLKSKQSKPGKVFAQTPKQLMKAILHPEIITVDEPLRFVAASCGTEHVLLLTSNGQVYSYGKNQFGQCGLGHKKHVSYPVLVENTYGVAKKIVAGHYHSGLINDKNEVFLWGWAVYGQLALDLDKTKDYHSSRLVPTKVTTLPLDLKIVDIALGYCHTLFLADNGIIYGCGGISFGQLALDYEQSKGQLKYLTPIKCFSLYKLPTPEPIKLLSSNYFHSVAIGESGTIYEWGSSPHSVKLKMCLTKKFNNTVRDQIKKQFEETAESNDKEDVNCEKQNDIEKQFPVALMKKIKSDVGKDYMKISIIEKWPTTGSQIKQISAGYSHSSLITEDGQLFTWGKGLDMQLGHGNKVQKEKPSKVIEPILTDWTFVIAGRCTTTALSSCGRVYVWGRNDKYQLGLGYTKKVERKFVLRNNESKTVDLPDDNCIPKPTPIPCLQVAASQTISNSERDRLLSSFLLTADQQTLVLISRNLAKHPIPIFATVQVHIAAGDILNAVDILCQLHDKSKTNTLAPSPAPPNIKSSITSPQKSLNSHSPRVQHLETNRNTPPPTFPWNLDDKNGNSSEGLPMSPASSISIKSDDDFFDDLLEKIWNLLRIHPYRDIQTLVLLRMLEARFPIYNRLAMDSRLCRLVDPFLELPVAASPSSSVHSSESSGHRKLADMVPKDRFVALKSAKLPAANKIKALKQKSEQSSPLDQLRFYTDCGHYEKYVVESGQAKAEFAALRNKLRKCTRCASKGKVQ
uniref:Uncharacterized protein n=1 Tax=Panagrolaimus sp. JU765 TaxID=591449 RepID=A0AC34Q9T5_9BILA